MGNAEYMGSLNTTPGLVTHCSPVYSQYIATVRRGLHTGEDCTQERTSHHHT